MNPKDIISKVNELQEKYKNRNLKCNPTYAGTIPLVLELIELYTNSKYRNSAVDSSGWRKPFYNIVENPTFVTSKMIDLDTKDVKVINEDWQSWVGSYIMDRELKLWMKEKNFGKLLNEIVCTLPKYGHVVLKKVGDEIFLVPISNMIVEPEKRWLKDMNCFAEKHIYSLEEFEKMPWDKTKIATLIKEYEKKKEYDVEVYESYSYENGLVIVAGNNISQSTIVYEDKKAKRNYKEIKFEDVVGRWLGRGQVERLFESQQSQNESFCYLMKGLKWSSSHFFQSRDGQIKNNLMTDAEDGDILTALSEINPIATEERNLGAYRYIDTLLGSSIQTRTFTQDVIRGDRPPAGTPLGTSQLQASMAVGFFDLKREDLGIFLKEIITEWVIPDFKKKNKKAKKIHLMKILGDAAGEKMFNMIVDNRVRQRQLDMALKGKLVGGQELEILKATIAESLKKENMDVPGNFYDDLNYKIDVVITGEQIDMSSKITTLQVVLQMLGSNPTIMQDPNTKRIFFKLLDWAGIPPESIMTEETPNMQNILAQRGGSLPAAPTQSVQPRMAMSQMNV